MFSKPHAFFLGKSDFSANIRIFFEFCVKFYHFLSVVSRKSHKCLANLLWMVFLNGRFAFVFAVFMLS